MLHLPNMEIGETLRSVREMPWGSFQTPIVAFERAARNR